MVNAAYEQAGSVPSVDTLDFVMESLALGHTVMDQRQVRASGFEVMGAAYVPGILAALFSPGQGLSFQSVQAAHADAMHRNRTNP